MFAEEWRTEALDAKGLALPGHQDALIEAVAAANPRTVVVLETGGPVTMPWLAGCRRSWQPGIRASPAARRSPRSCSVASIHPAGCPSPSRPTKDNCRVRCRATRQSWRRAPACRSRAAVVQISYDIEGSDVGYRWFARQGQTPLFRFGFGLSYTQFALSDLSVERRDGALVGVPDGDECRQAVWHRHAADLRVAAGPRRVRTTACSLRPCRVWNLAKAAVSSCRSIPGSSPATMSLEDYFALQPPITCSTQERRRVRQSFVRVCDSRRPLRENNCRRADGTRADDIVI